MNLTVSYSEVRKNLKSHLDRVCDDHLPMVVSRKNGENVVIMSEDDYRSLEETLHIMKSPKKYARILEALQSKKSYTLEQVKNELGI